MRCQTDGKELSIAAILEDIEQDESFFLLVAKAGRARRHKIGCRSRLRDGHGFGFPCGLGRVTFTEDLCREPKRLEQCLCVVVDWRRRGLVDARKRDAGATRALVGWGKLPFGGRVEGYGTAMEIGGEERDYGR